MSSYRDDTTALRDLFGSLQGQLLDAWSRWPETLRRRVEKTLVERIEAILSISTREAKGFTAKTLDHRARSLRDVTKKLAEAGQELGVTRQRDIAYAPDLLDPTILLRWAPLDLDRRKALRKKDSFLLSRVSTGLVHEAAENIRIYNERIDQALKQEAFELIENDRFLHPSWFRDAFEATQGVITHALVRYRGRPLRVHIKNNAALDGNSKTFEGEDDFTLAAYVDALVGSLSVSPEGYRHMLIRPFRREDIEFSDPSFDGLFWVRAEDPEEGRQILSEDARKKLCSLATNAIPSLKLEEGVLTMTWKWTVNSRDLFGAISAMDGIATQAEAIHQRRLAQIRAPR